MRKPNPILYLYFPFRLTGEQAFMATLFLESAVRSLWRAYGDEMADFQGRVFPDHPSPLSELYCTPEDDDADL